jgi:hypothetical protein
MAAQIKAPWSKDQVAALNAYQHAGVFHPFTCGNGSHTLTATADGWICDECASNGGEYRQDWCWDWMADGSWQRKE